MKISLNQVKEDKRKTTLMAKKIMATYILDRSLYGFAVAVSGASMWFGRYGSANRMKFLEALKDQIDRRL
jgi:hypothetical protein